MKNLRDLLGELFFKSNGHAPNADELALIDQILDENGFFEADATPEWLLALLSHVVSERSSAGRRPYSSKSHDGDDTNLFAELEDLINANWDDYGTALEITFHFGVFVYLGRMGRSWEVKLIKHTHEI